MDKKKIKLIQHQLIPAALIAGNVALAHVIYLFANCADFFILLTTITGLLLLTIGIIRPNRYLLLIAIAWYIIILGCSLSGW